MPESASPYDVADPAATAAEPKRNRDAYRWRLLARSLGVAAVAALIVALALNWLTLEHAGTLHQTVAERVTGVATVYAPSTVPPDMPTGKAPVEMLPDTIIQYETISRQPVAGQADLAGEAIYTTLDMSLENQRPMNSYVRVEAQGSEEAAQRRVQELMQPYTVNPETRMAGGAVPARSGFNQELSAWAVGWTYDAYAVFVKTSFREIAPVRDQEKLLHFHGDRVVDAVAVFQRTGQQGIEANRSDGGDS